MLQQFSTKEILNRKTIQPDYGIEPQVKEILENVRNGGDVALRKYCLQFDAFNGDALVLEREELERAYLSLSEEEQGVLKRTAERIRAFAEAQRCSLVNLTTTVDGGRAGHIVAPLKRAACYAPGGRYPLPSSVLMTAVTAKAAGVETVWVISPKPNKYTLAAAAIAGADALLVAGGAHAIAAVAYGTEQIPAFDIVVGPGNRWVTVAKQLVAGQIKIDMLAGPSELLVVADASADPAVIATDLLAQAEHDPDSIVGLVALDRELLLTVNDQLTSQLALLATREIAEQSLRQGYSVIVESIEEAARMCNHIAPEHLSIQTVNPTSLHPLLTNYGGLFLGRGSAEVLGDYGLGPNHVLPTGGSARSRGGLSVLDFLIVRTWLEVQKPSVEAIEDILALAAMEGLDGHRKSLLVRL